jgi:DMSO/TMAO reductase YedYZ molybdopterin-dependent catalytic subunit
MAELRIVGTGGSPAISLTAADCAAMPESAQVPDVSALVPGKAGRGLRLAALLPKSSRAVSYLHVASIDPAFAISLPLAEASNAIVVYSLDGAPLPEKKGGPFRLLVPGHADECVHVKQLASLEFSDRPGRDTRPKDDAAHEALHRKCKTP